MKVLLQGVQIPVPVVIISELVDTKVLIVEVLLTVATLALPAELQLAVVVLFPVVRGAFTIGS